MTCDAERLRERVNRAEDYEEAWGEAFARRVRKALRRTAARHEAAHAVVAVREGLGHLIQTVTIGLADYDGAMQWIPSTADSMVAQLTSPNGVATIRAMATVIAAGINVTPGRHSDGDKEQLADIAWMIGESYKEVAQSSRQRAKEILMCDTGAVWDRLTTALLRKKTLSGEEVLRIVASVDRSAAVENDQ